MNRKTRMRLKTTMALAVGLLFAQGANAAGTAACKYELNNVWWGGGTANVSITNQGTDTLHGWQVSWTYSDGSYVSGSAWNGVVTGTKPTFTASDGGGWNKDIPPGGTASFGFNVAGQNAMNANIPQVTGSICNNADDDGVLFVAAQRAEQVLVTAHQIWQSERDQARRIREGQTLRQQTAFDDYLARSAADPSYTFRRHLRRIGGAIEE